MEKLFQNSEFILENNLATYLRKWLISSLKSNQFTPNVGKIFFSYKGRYFCRHLAANISFSVIKIGSNVQPGILHLSLNLCLTDTTPLPCLPPIPIALNSLPIYFKGRSLQMSIFCKFLFLFCTNVANQEFQ